MVKKLTKLYQIRRVRAPALPIEDQREAIRKAVAEIIATHKFGTFKPKMIKAKARRGETDVSPQASGRMRHGATAASKHSEN